MSSPVIHTLGHSSRTQEAFVELLCAHGIERLVDVRRFPGSRRHPHFGAERLATALGAAGITYEHVPGLGGRRSPDPESPNTAWRNAGFRAYADHMASSAFRDALDLVISGAGVRTALMCAEAVPWRCHRQLIADALVVRGIRVRHILAPDRVQEHELSPMARVADGGTITYPGEDQRELFHPADAD